MHVIVNKAKLLSALTVHTESSFESFHFSADYAGNIIKKLDSSKALRHDMIGILMLKLCGDSIFKNYLKEVIFPDE